MDKQKKENKMDDFKQITCRISKKAGDKLRTKCFKLKISQNTVMIELIEIWIRGKINIPQQGDK